jgi:adenylyl-sulfate kinase
VSLRSPEVVWQPELPRERRYRALGQCGATLWFTGLPSSGKSTIAAAVQEQLLGQGRFAYTLDGDNLRHGLCGDLGFSPEDRAENVRRTAHAARLLADAGAVAIVSLVSPYAADRELARELHERDGLPFLEVYVATPLHLCEERDPKGLYARARSGELRGFTGVDDPYEAPVAADLVLRSEQGVAEAATRVVAAVPPVL